MTVGGHNDFSKQRQPPLMSAIGRRDAHQPSSSERHLVHQRFLASCLLGWLGLGLPSVDGR